MVAGEEEPVVEAATAGKSDCTHATMKAAGLSGLFYWAVQQGYHTLTMFLQKWL